MKTKKSLKPKGRWKLWLSWTALVLILVFVVLRESDYPVSRLYYTGWPIYNDYVYPPGIEKISFKSLDGTPLSGWYIRSHSPLAAKRPVLLYIHGNSGNLAAQYSQFSFFADWDYDLFAFDYRGFGLSGGHPSRQGLAQDTQAAFDELTLLQPHRPVGVVGFSMGAANAVWLAAHEPRVTAVAALGCFTTYCAIGAYDLGVWGFPHWTTPLITWLLVPNGYDPLTACQGQLLPPALFVHGTADGNIPHEMGEAVEQSYSGPKTLLLMPGYGHGDYSKGPLGQSFHEALDQLFRGPIYAAGI